MKENINYRILINTLLTFRHVFKCFKLSNGNLKLKFELGIITMKHVDVYSLLEEIKQLLESIQHIKNSDNSYYPDEVKKVLFQLESKLKAAASKLEKR